MAPQDPKAPQETRDQTDPEVSLVHLAPQEKRVTGCHSRVRRETRVHKGSVVPLAPLDSHHRK